MVNKHYTVQHQSSRKIPISGGGNIGKRYSPPPVRNLSVISDAPNPQTTAIIKVNGDRRTPDSPGANQKSLDTINEEQHQSVFGRNITFYNRQFLDHPPSSNRFSVKDLSINDIGRFQYILQMDREMANQDSFYGVPSCTRTSSNSNSINSSNHVNFWKAGSESPITSPPNETRFRYLYERYLKIFWKYAKWPLLLLTCLIFVSVIIYFVVASQSTSRKNSLEDVNSANKREIVDNSNKANMYISSNDGNKPMNILTIFEVSTKLFSDPTKITKMPKIYHPVSSKSTPISSTTKASSTTLPTTTVTTTQAPNFSEVKTSATFEIENVSKETRMDSIEEQKPSAEDIIEAIVVKTSAEKEFITPIILPESSSTNIPFRNTQILKILTQDDSILDDDLSTTTEIFNKENKPFSPTKDTIQVIGFTSGHQNNFGVPIEEDERILRILNEELIRNAQNETIDSFNQTTTDASVYKPRVSPTLPVIYRGGETTESIPERITNTSDVGTCKSTSLEICRGILQYDLTTAKSKRILSQLEVDHFKYLIDSKCSTRAAEFVCSALEPECRPTQMGILQPCKRICKSILEPCASIIASSEVLTMTFDCDSYPDSSDRNVCEDPTRRNNCYDNEFKCLDSSCIPLQWKCDNIKDCSLGEDEDNCMFCEHDEFRCQTIDKCIPDKWRCDQYNDCPDGSDEVDCYDYDDIEVVSDDYPGPRIYSFASVQSPNSPKDRPYLTISEEDRLSEEEKQTYENSEQFLPTAPSDNIAFSDADDIKTNTTDDNDEIQKGAASGRVVVGLGVPKNLANFQDSKEIMMTSDSETDFKYSTGNGNNNQTTTVRTTDSSSSTLSSTTLADENRQNVSEESSSSTAFCPENKLRCVSGKCITVDQICDKTIDCPDGADEAMCVYKN